MILSITTDFAGQVGVRPRIVRLQTNDSLSAITTANYLGAAQKEGFTFYPDDIFAITYGANGTTSQIFTASISGGIITLVALPGSLTTSVTSGDFPIFDGTTGALKDIGFSPTDNTKTKVVMASAATTSGNIAQFNDTAGTVGDGGLAANKVMTATFTSPNAGSNIVSFDVACTAAAMASGGSVILYPSSGSKQFKVRALNINAGGTNFSGGALDRNIIVTDGTNVYASIPSASAQALVNAVWGNSNLGLQNSPAMNTSTVAGANIVAKYSGGSSDYTAGSVVISGLLERVA